MGGEELGAEEKASTGTPEEATRASTAEPEPEDAAAASVEEGKWPKNTRVLVHGLKGAPELNGLKASVVRWIPDTGRYRVAWKDKKEGKTLFKNLKAANLTQVIKKAVAKAKAVSKLMAAGAAPHLAMRQRMIAAAEGGDTQAMIQLFMGYQGSGDAVSAQMWLRRAADAGLAGAQFQLGVHCSQQGNVEAEKEAVEWFRKASDQGHPDAQCNLAIFSYHGLAGVPQDDVEAARLFRAAAEQGHAQAQTQLGAFLMDGVGVEKDEAAAAAMFEKAAAQGHAEAQFNIGCSYSTGQGVVKDEAAAVSWYEKAANNGEKGNADAQVNLAIMLSNGQGVEKDEAKAVEWLVKSAEQGQKDAQANLGICYEQGNGVPKSREDALKWLGLAAKQGQPDAEVFLAELIAAEQRPAAPKARTATAVPPAADTAEPVAKGGDYSTAVYLAGLGTAIGVCWCVYTYTRGGLGRAEKKSS